MWVMIGDMFVNEECEYIETNKSYEEIMKDYPFELTISKFVKNTNEIVDEFDVNDNNFNRLVASERDKYDFRLTKYKDCGLYRQTTSHFGVNVSNSGDNLLNEGTYANKHLEWITKNDFYGIENFIYKCLGYEENDLRLNLTEQTSFQLFIEKFTNEYKLNKIDNLNELKQIRGIYFLVLENRRMCYVGQSNDLKKRIMEHWRNFRVDTKGIDMYRALDTTAIYYVKIEDLFLLNDMEHKMVKDIPNIYRVNSIAGGNISYLSSLNKDIMLYNETDYRALVETKYDLSKFDTRKLKRSENYELMEYIIWLNRNRYKMDI